MQRVLFLWLLLVLFVVSLTVVAQGEEQHIPTQREEQQQEEEGAPVPVPESPAPVDDDDDDDDETVPANPEPQQDEAALPPHPVNVQDVPTTLTEKKKSSNNILCKIKSQTSKVMDKCGSLVSKCKNMSKKDLKKAAVAVVGVWGVSVGVGWLVQTLGETSSTTTPEPKGGPFKKK